MAGSSPSVRQATSRKNLQLGIGIGFILAALLLAVLWLSEAIDDLQPHIFGVNFELASAFLGLWLAAIIAWWSRRRGRFDPFEPPTFISLNIYLQVVLNIWLLQRDIPSYVPWVRDHSSQLMPQAVLLYGFGLTVLWIAYIASYKKVALWAALAAKRELEPRYRNILLVWLVGWLVGNLAVWSGYVGYLGTGAGTWQNYLAFVEAVTWLAMGVLAIRQFRQPTMYGSVWLTLVVVSDLILSLVVGSKVFALHILWLSIFYFYARDRFPLRWWATGFLAVLLFVPVIMRYRTNLQALDLGAGVSLPGRVQALSNAILSSLDQPAGSSIESTQNSLQQRQAGIFHITASALYLHPQRLPYQGWEMVQYFFPQLIPRVVWPGKPSERPALLLITTTYGSAEREYSLSSIGLMADSYRAGGWLVLAGFSLFLGVFMAWLYIRGPARGRLAETVFCVVVLTQFLRYDSEITTLLINLLQFGLLMWLILRYFMFTSSPGPAESTGRV
jgi:hypothetical protein